MTTTFRVLEPNGLSAHIWGGMIQSLLSPFPNDPRLHTHFLDLQNVPKCTITDTNFNIVQQLNLLANNANSSTAPNLYNIGINAINELYIKLEGEDDVLGGANPPALYIDNTGTVSINGAALPIGSQDGFIYQWDTTGVPAFNRNNATLSVTGNFIDPATGADRYDNVFYGAPPAPQLNWNPVYLPPAASVPVTQTILNQNPIPGAFPSGFITAAPAPTKLPVTCTISGRFAPVTAIDGASIINVNHSYNTGNPATTTFNYTLRVGVVRQIYQAAPIQITFTDVVSQDITIPFSGNYTGNAASFSVSFTFDMTQRDPATGNPQSFIPYFLHNGVIMPATTGNLRWVNLSVQFKTHRNI